MNEEWCVRRCRIELSSIYSHSRFTHTHNCFRHCGSLNSIFCCFRISVDVEFSVNRLSSQYYRLKLISHKTTIATSDKLMLGRHERNSIGFEAGEMCTAIHDFISFSSAVVFFSYSLSSLYTCRAFLTADRNFSFNFIDKANPKS